MNTPEFEQNSGLSTAQWVMEVHRGQQIFEGSGIKSAVIALQPNIAGTSLSSAVVWIVFEDRRIKGLEIMSAALSDPSAIAIRRWMHDAFTVAIGACNRHDFARVNEPHWLAGDLRNISKHDAILELVRVEACARLLRASGIPEVAARKIHAIFASRQMDVFGPALFQLAGLDEQMCLSVAALDRHLFPAIHASHLNALEPKAGQESILNLCCEQVERTLKQSDPEDLAALNRIGIFAGITADALGRNETVRARSAALLQEIVMSIRGSNNLDDAADRTFVPLTNPRLARDHAVASRQRRSIRP